ncbi:MAG: sulfite reductase [Ferrovum sp. 37-45-19]|uniref:nitrite/sulfite reductase n=1 Tax=Ferrovum sp. JA12 TaxID=1356299 RepID=UPI000702F9FC|nr:nitrite/sulfite reductase [Ferrovum sp. JA12]OYV79865.1 MAG: sulfite reductase [Ferrovum sp. 21-44-67]OYV95489.1 MAG: sulfite reductase [Ferrovum sp. 37-45-19]OZB31534.1 MAG: sulfite reductase [Ferrovum sp. 34-44-207]HQU05738.1 nitrite/sulfite reductase [Ferrovaceae bacterium]KRH78173.1 sulfite reductase [Ferrovum sp. JA12]
MYIYDEIDQQIVNERVAQFRDQTLRFLDGKLTEDEFRPLRLQNGLYIQRHAPMLRVAIPYGVLSSQQLKQLAHIARTYDRGTGHFTTRQNIQFNWPKLADVPDILSDLAAVQMHSIQTSGNCVRNTTADHFAGVAYDEIIDPRVYCELIRQWSTFHPEFAFLPRKFKIAVNGALQDRAATMVHDIGLHAVRDSNHELGFRVIVGGGLGRTPMIGVVIREFLPEKHLLSYLDAILRVYNRYGRRDNKFKARIKILVKAMTPEKFSLAVEEEWLRLKDGPTTLIDEEIKRIEQRIPKKPYQTLNAELPADVEAFVRQPHVKPWYERNVFPHKQQGYKAITVSLKALGQAPGDMSAEQMEKVAEIAERVGFGEVRVSHEQNLILPDVPNTELISVYEELRALGLTTANIGLLSDIISCPGGDYCSLANARSIPVAQAIQQQFSDLDYLYDIGELDLNISGCMNACGHHHVGHIGILGVDKHGEEFYQITIGGSQAPARLGKVIGPSLKQEDVPQVIETLITVYLQARVNPEERFVDVVERLGIEPFKTAVYGRKEVADEVVDG